MQPKTKFQKNCKRFDDMIAKGVEPIKAANHLASVIVSMVNTQHSLSLKTDYANQLLAHYRKNKNCKT